MKKKDLAKIKTDTASQQRQTTGLLLQQRKTCNLPNIRPGPKKASRADSNPRQTCTVKHVLRGEKHVPRGEYRTGLPSSTTTQRNPPMPIFS